MFKHSEGIAFIDQALSGVEAIIEGDDEIEGLESLIVEVTAIVEDALLRARVASTPLGECLEEDVDSTQGSLRV